MTRGFGFLVAAAVAGVVALGCSGRSAAGDDLNLNDGVNFDAHDGDTGRDTGKDTGKDGTGFDGVNPSDTSGEYTGPVADAISKIQKSDASVICPPAGTTSVPAFVNGETGLGLDVVVTSPRYTVSKDKTSGEVTKYGYMVADAGLTQSEAWRGIAITVPVAVTTDEWAVGDALSIVGDHVEYYCFTQVEVTSATPKGTAPNPAPLEIDPADLGGQDAATAEQYEGVLVRVRNVEVTETPHNGSDGKDHGAFKVTGGLIVANDFYLPYMSTATDARKVGDTFDEIVGVVKYSFGEYILTPRFASDMVLHGTQPGDTGPTDDLPAQDVIEQEIIPGAATIESIQSNSGSTGCTTTSSITTVQAGLTFADLVVVSPKFVASTGKLDGYYVSDTGMTTTEPFTGALLTLPVALASAFVPGDVIQVTGDWLEFYCMTEIKGTAATKASTATAPAPKVVTAANLKDAATAETLEGVLVELDNVTVTLSPALGNDDKDHGGFEVADGVTVVNDFKLNYMSTATDQRKVGDAFSKIVGVVAFQYGKYVIVPRSNEDLVLGTPVTPDTVEPTPDVVEPSPEVVDNGGTDVPVPAKYSIVDLQGGADSDNCVNATATANDAPKYGIVLKPVVVTSPQFSAASTMHGYYVADADGAATDAGMLLLVSKSLNTAFVPGDVLDATGDYLEYFCMSEFAVLATATAPKTVGTVTKTGTGTIPAPTVLAASVLENGGGAAAEPYESQIVTLQNVAVTNVASSDGKGWFQVGTGIEVASDFFYPLDTAPYTPVLNQNLTSLTGALKFHWGKYRIVPRTAADFVVAP